MKIADVMTKDPVVCMPDTPLDALARLMVEHDCGVIPVVSDASSRQLAGVVTDRDIVCRTLAEGINPLEKTAGDCMSSPCHTAGPDEELDQCVKMMEDHQIRRAPLVDDHGCCCGVVALADIARATSEAGELVHAVSQPR